MSQLLAHAQLEAGRLRKLATQAKAASEATAAARDDARSNVTAAIEGEAAAAAEAVAARGRIEARGVAAENAATMLEKMAAEAEAKADALAALQGKDKALQDASDLDPATLLALQSLDRRQLAEVRKLPSPPAKVRTTMSVVFHFIDRFTGGNNDADERLNRPLIQPSWKAIQSMINSVDLSPVLGDITPEVVP